MGEEWRWMMGTEDMGARKAGLNRTRVGAASCCRFWAILWACMKTWGNGRKGRNGAPGFRNWENWIRSRPLSDLAILPVSYYMVLSMVEILYCPFKLLVASTNLSNDAKASPLSIAHLARRTPSFHLRPPGPVSRITFPSSPRPKLL